MKEELSKTEINKTIGKVTKALNDPEKSVLVITDGITVGKGNLVEILSGIGVLLKNIRNESVIGKLAVDGLLDAMEAIKKKDKKVEDMTTEEQVDTLKGMLEVLKGFIKK